MEVFLNLKKNARNSYTNMCVDTKQTHTYIQTKHIHTNKTHTYKQNTYMAKMLKMKCFFYLNKLG